MFDDYGGPGHWGVGYDYDMAETPPRRVSYRSPWDDSVPKLAYVAGGGAAVFAIGTAVYIKRHDWLRAIVCAALSGACGYGLYRILINYWQ